MKMLDLKKNAATIAAWILAFAAIGWMALDTFAAGSKINGATEIEDDLTTGSAGGVGLTGGTYDVSGSLGQVATMETQNGATELAGGYFAFPDITNLAASPGPFNGSVKLTWSWPESLTAGSSFYVQYSTFSAGMAWDASKAQVVRSTGPVTMGAGGATFVVGGLDTGRDGSDGDITPAYYFRVFSKPAAGSFSPSSNEASQAPVMPGILSTAAFVNFGTIGTPGGGWLQTVNGSANGSDIGYAVMHDDAENGAYVVGIFRGAGGNDDIFVRRYSPNGDTIWTKYYNGPGNGNDIARRIWVGNGQVYVVGSEARPDLAQSDNLLLINYSTAGVLQWTTTYNSPDNLADWGNGVDVDGAGITVAGMENRSTGGQNILVRRYNFEGSLLWSDTYDSGGSDYANQVKSDGAYVYVLGEAYGGSSNGQDLWMRKYSIAGVMQWTTTYNSPYNLTDRGMGLAVKFSDVFVVGDQYVDGSGNSDALYQKYGAADARLYTQVIDPSAGGKRTWHDVALDPGGLGVYVAGRRGPSTNTDIVVRKYDNAAGLEQWTTTYAGPGAGNDEGVGIFVSKSSNVYVTGYERRSAGQYDDAWVRRYNYDAFQSSGAGNTKTWKGVMNGAASDGTNWWEGFPPQTNDYVVFGATSPTNNCDWNLAVTLSSMTFKSGYAGTVTFSSQVVILQKFEMLTPDATAFFKYDPANPGAIKHRIEGLVDLATGTFKVERTTLTALNAVVVTSATFYLKDGAVFEGFELGSWDGAGMVRMAGPLAPVVTSTSPDSAIEFKLIDNVDISSGIFQRLNANGVQICSGANLVSFSSFTLAGPLLPGTTAINFYCGGVFTSTFTNINFADPNIAVNVGAQSLNNASRITMREAKGSQAGEAYDADPAGFPDVVEWPTATGGAAGISDLNASPGPNIGSVKLTWNWPTQLNSGSSYHVQYATYASAAWDISKAQITVSTGPVNLANGATIYVGGLDIGRDSADVDVSPVYYFRVFVTSNPAGSISPSSNQAQSAANTPPAQTNTPTDYANGWLRTTNNASNGYDEWHGVAVDAANDVYVAGHQEITPNNFGIILRKYNSLGNTLWTKWFDGNSSASDESYGIALSASGDLYVTGYFNSAGGFEDLLLRKYSPSGLLLWTTSYNSPDNLYDQGSGVAADANAVYVAGSSSRSVGGMNVLVRKYDHNGLSLWTTSYNNPGNTGDEALGLALYGGYLYVAGWTDVGGQAENWWLAKYDSNSLLLWTTTYNSPSNGTDMANAVAADASGVYVVGETSGGVQGPNVMVRKYDANALLVWTTTYNGPAAGGNDKAYGVALDASGVYVTGEYDDVGQSSNVWVRKYDKNGLLQWTTTYNGSANSEDIGVGIAVKDGNVFVAGLESVAGPQFNTWLRRWSADAFGGGAGGGAVVKAQSWPMNTITTMIPNANDFLLMGTTVWVEGGSVSFSSVAVSLLGNAPASQVMVKVWKDVDMNGGFEPGTDQDLGSGYFAAGTPPKASVWLGPTQTLTGTTQHYFLTVSYSSMSAGKDMELSIESPSDVSVTVNQVVGAFPLKSGKRTVWGDLYARPSNPFVSYSTPTTPNIGGFDAGLYLTSGQQVNILTQGFWDSGGPQTTSTGDVVDTCGGSCVVSSTNSGRMIYRIGSADWSALPWTSSTITVTGSGNLYFGMNDTPSGYENNSGALSLMFKVMTSTAAKVWKGGTAGDLYKANLDSNWLAGQKPFEGETVWFDNSSYDCDWDIPNLKVGLLAMTTAYAKTLRIVSAGGLDNKLIVSSNATIGRGTVDLQWQQMEVQGTLLAHSSATLDLASGGLYVKDALILRDAAYLKAEQTNPVPHIHAVAGGGSWAFRVENATVTVSNPSIIPYLYLYDVRYLDIGNLAKINAFNGVSFNGVAGSSANVVLHASSPRNLNLNDWRFNVAPAVNVNASDVVAGSNYIFYYSSGGNFGSPYEYDPNSAVFWVPDGGGSGGSISGRLDYAGSADGDYQLRITTQAGVMGAGQTVYISSGAVGYTVSNLSTPATYYIYGFKNTANEPWNDDPRGGVGNPGAWRSQALYLANGASLTGRDITIQDWATISGNITVNTSQAGPVRLHAWRGSNPPVSGTLESAWYPGDFGGAYSFYAPPASDYTIIAFKDVDNDDQLDNFEAFGSSTVIQVAALATHSGTDITITGGSNAPGGTVYVSTKTLHDGSVAKSGPTAMTKLVLWSVGGSAALSGLNLEYNGVLPASNFEMEVSADSNGNGVYDDFSDSSKGSYNWAPATPSSGVVMFSTPDTILSGSTYFLVLRPYDQMVSQAGIKISSSSNFALSAGQMASQPALYPMISTGDVRLAVMANTYAYSDNTGGFYTGLWVYPGQSLSIDAKGVWVSSSNGTPVDADGFAGTAGYTTVQPSAKLGELIGRISDGPTTSPWFRLGKSTAIVSNYYGGSLYLAMNDYSGSQGDNTGFVLVKPAVSGSTTGALSGTVWYSGGVAGSMDVAAVKQGVYVATVTLAVGAPASYPYSIAELPPGDYIVKAQHQTQAGHKGDSVAPKTVSAGQTAYQDVNVSEGAATINGTLFYSGGQTWGDFIVAAATHSDVGDETVFFGSTTLTSAGAYSITGLPAPRTYFLAAVRDGNNNKRLDGYEAFGYYDGASVISSAPVREVWKTMAPVPVTVGGTANSVNIRLLDKGAINGAVTVSSAVASGAVVVEAGRGEPGTPGYYIENDIKVDILGPATGYSYSVGLLRPATDYSVNAFLDQNGNEQWDGSEPFFRSMADITVSSVGSSGRSISLNAPAVPPAVAGFRGEAADNGVNFYWTLAQGATQYELRNITDVTLWTLAQQTTFFAETGLGPNAASPVRRITASNSVGAGPFAELPVSTYSKAALPAGPILSGIYQSSVTLSWGFNGNPVGTQYEVHRATGATNPGEFVKMGSTTLSNFTDVGLNPGQSYWWRLYSRNFRGIETGPSISSGTATVGAAAPSISGTVSYDGLQLSTPIAKSNNIYVEASTTSLFTTPSVAKVMLPKLASQPYYLPAPAGTYYVRGFADVTGNGAYDAGEDAGFFGAPTAVAVAAGPVTGRDVTIASDTLRPGIPVGLTASAGVGMVTLTWGKPATNINDTPINDLGGFRIWRSSGTYGAPVSTLTAVALSSWTLRYDDYSPSPDFPNTYQVLAVDYGLNASSPSMPVSASLGAMISGRLSTFTATTGGLPGQYRIRLSTMPAPDAPFLAERALANMGTFSFTNLSTGTYYVRAHKEIVNDDKVSPFRETQAPMTGKYEPRGTLGGVNTPYPLPIWGTNSVSGSTLAVCDSTPIFIVSTGVVLTDALTAVDCRAEDKGDLFFADIYGFDVGSGQPGSVGAGADVEIRVDAPTLEEELVVIDPLGVVAARDNNIYGASQRVIVSTPGVYLVQVTTGPLKFGAYTLSLNVRGFGGGIRGGVSCSLGGPGPIKVQAFDNPDPRAFPLRTVDLPSPGLYILSDLADNATGYYVRGFKDVNLNGVYDAGEPSGAYGPPGSPTKITVIAGVPSPGTPADFVVSQPAFGTIEGTIHYTGSQSGPIRIQAGKRECSDCDFLNVVAAASTGAAYSYALSFLPPATDYYVRAFVDGPAPGAPLGDYQPQLMEARVSSTPVNVIGMATTTLSLELVEPGSGISGDAVIRGTITYAGANYQPIYVGFSRTKDLTTLDYMMSVVRTGDVTEYAKSGVYGGTTYYVGAFMDLNGNMNPDEAAGEPMGEGVTPGFAGEPPAPVYVPLTGLVTANVLLEDAPNGSVAGQASFSDTMFPGAPLQVEVYLPGVYGPGGGRELTIERTGATYYMYTLGNLAASTGTAVVNAFIDSDRNRWVDPGEPVAYKYSVAIASQAGAAPGPTVLNLQILDAGSMGGGNTYGVVEATVSYVGGLAGDLVVRFFDRPEYLGMPGSLANPVATLTQWAPSGSGDFFFRKEGLSVPATYWMDAFRDGTGTGTFDPAYQAYGSYFGSSATLSALMPYYSTGPMLMRDPGTSAGTDGRVVSGALRYNGAGGGPMRAILRVLGSSVAFRMTQSAYTPPSTAFSFTNVSTGTGGAIYGIVAYLDRDGDAVPDPNEPIAVSTASGVWLGAADLTGMGMVLCERSPLTPGVEISTALAETDCPAPDRDGAYQKLFTFPGSRNQPVTIEMKAAGFYDSYLNLYDPYGNREAFDDESAGMGDARIVKSLALDGPYTIGASAFQPGVTGDFKLKLSGSAAKPGSISGQVVYGGTQGGQIIAGLFNSPIFSSAAMTANRILLSTRSFLFDGLVPGASYYLGAFMDVDKDMAPSPGEDAGLFGFDGVAQPILLSDGQNMTGLDVVIQVSSAAAGDLGYISGVASYTATAGADYTARFMIEIWPTAGMTGRPSAVREFFPVTVEGAPDVSYFSYDVGVPGNASYFVRGFLDADYDFMPSTGDPKGVYSPYVAAEPVYVPVSGVAGGKDFRLRDPGINYMGQITGLGTAVISPATAGAGLPVTLTMTYTADASEPVLSGAKVGLFLPPGWSPTWDETTTLTGVISKEGPAVWVTLSANLNAGLSGDIVVKSSAPCMLGLSTFTVVSARDPLIAPSKLVDGSPQVVVAAGVAAYFVPKTPFFSVRQNRFSDEQVLQVYDSCGNRSQVAGSAKTATLRSRKYDFATGQYVDDADFGYAPYSTATLVTVEKATASPVSLKFEVGRSSASFWVFSSSTGYKTIELTDPGANKFYYGFNALPQAALSVASVTLSPTDAAGSTTSVTFYPGSPAKGDKAFVNFNLCDAGGALACDPYLGWRVVVSSASFKPGVEARGLWERWGQGQPALGSVFWDGRYSPWINNGMRVPNGTYYVLIEAGGIRYGDKNALKLVVSSLQLKGRVYDDKTALLPLSGAAVDAYGPGGGGKVWTDGAGEFVLPIANSGVFYVFLSKPEYLSGSATGYVDLNGAVSSWTATTADIRVSTNAGRVDFYMKSPPFLRVTGAVGGESAAYDRWGSLAIRKLAVSTASYSCASPIMGETIWGSLRVGAGGLRIDDGGKWDPGTQMMVYRSSINFQVAAGTYAVEAGFPGFAPACTVKSVEADGASQDFGPDYFMKLSTISGTVTIPAGGNPNGMFVSVTAIPVSSTSKVGYGGAWLGANDESEPYAVLDLEPGWYVLKANAPGYPMLEDAVDFEVSSNNVVSNKNFNFAAGRSISGVATINTVTTDTDLKLNVYAWSPSSFTYASTEVSQPGGGASGLPLNYTLSNLADGTTYQIYANLVSTTDFKLESYELPLSTFLPIGGDVGGMNFSLTPSNGKIAGVLMLPAGSTDFMHVDVRVEVVASARPAEAGQAFVQVSTSLPGFACLSGALNADGTCPAGANGSTATFTVTDLHTQTLDVTARYRTTGQTVKNRLSVVNGLTTGVTVYFDALALPTYSIEGKIINEISTPTFKASDAGPCANIVNNASVQNPLKDPKGVVVPASDLFVTTVPNSLASLARVVAIRQEMAGYGLKVSTSFNPVTDRVGYITHTGTYTIGNMPPGSYFVRTEDLRACAACPVLAPGVGRLVTVSTFSRTGVNFTLSDGFAASGKVYLDESMEDSTTFYLTVYNKRQEVVRSTTAYLGSLNLGLTANSVDYSFGNLPGGEFYSLVVRDASWPPKFAGRPIRFPDPKSAGMQSDLAGQDVKMLRAATIIGKLRDEYSGESITQRNVRYLAPSFEIKAVANPFVDGAYMVAQTTAAGAAAPVWIWGDGTFRIYGLIPSDSVNKVIYDLKLAQTSWDPGFLARGSQNYVPATVSGLLVQPGEVRDVGTRGLSQGLHVRGVVKSTPTAQALGNIKVVARPSFGAMDLKVETFTKPNGEYAVWASTSLVDVTVAPRDGNLASDGTSYAEVTVRNFNLQSTTTLNFALTALAGKTTDYRVVGDLSYPFGDKKGFPAAAVNIQPFCVVPLKNPLGDLEIVTDSDGKFQIPALSTAGFCPPNYEGRYAMRVTSLGYRVYKATVAVSSSAAAVYNGDTGLAVADFRLVLSTGATLSGRILKGDGITAPSIEEVGGIAAAYFDPASPLNSEYAVGALEFENNVVSRYHLPGLAPNVTYYIVILPKNKKEGLPAYPPNGRYWVDPALGALRELDLTYPSNELDCTAGSKALGNRQFQIKIACSDPLRNETGDDNDLDVILRKSGVASPDAVSPMLPGQPVGGAGELRGAEKALSLDRRQITAIYRAADGEDYFSLVLEATSSAKNFENGRPYFKKKIFDFFADLDSHSSGKVSNIEGGSVNLELSRNDELSLKNEKSYVTMDPGSFAACESPGDPACKKVSQNNSTADPTAVACASCTVTVSVSKTTDSALALLLPQAMGGKGRLNSVPTEIAEALRAYRAQQTGLGPGMNPLSSFYAIFLPASVRNQLKRQADVTLSFDLDKTSDTSKVHIYWLNRETNRWVEESTNQRIDAVNKTITASVWHFSTFVVSDGAPAYSATQVIASEGIHAFGFPNPGDCITHVGVTADTRGWAAGTTHPAFDGVMIRYTLPISGANKREAARINIYNVAGELVRTIDQGYIEGNRTYYMPWNCGNQRGKSVGSGIYFAEVVWGAQRQYFKIAIIKGSGL